REIATIVCEYKPAPIHPNIVNVVHECIDIDQLAQSSLLHSKRLPDEVDDLLLGSCLGRGINQRWAYKILKPAHNHEHPHFLVAQREHRLENAPCDAGIKNGEQEQDRK